MNMLLDIIKPSNCYAVRRNNCVMSATQASHITCCHYSTSLFLLKEKLIANELFVSRQAKQITEFSVGVADTYINQLNHKTK
jgi:hypothetical protein